MAGRRISGGERIAAIAATSAIVGALALLLMLGLASHRQDGVEHALPVFDVREFLPPPPPPARQTVPTAHPRRTGHAAPPARTAFAVPVVVPPRPAPTAPVISAPIVAEGDDDHAGAAFAIGPGPGAAGIGEGFGAGGAGSGTGGGIATPARLVSGAITPRDYPRRLRKARIGGTVTVRFTVGADGRVRGCATTRSSGVEALDALTCALIGDRFRYAPAVDAAGRAVAQERGWRQRWWVEDGDPQDAP